MKKTFIYILIVILLGYFSWVGFLWKFFNSGIAGSYPHAEAWTLNITEEKLIEAIIKVRSEHPEMVDSENVNIIQDNGFKHIVFYYKDSNERVQTWVRSNEDANFTTIALISISKVDNAKNETSNFSIDRKEINKDFGYFENRTEINKFEKKFKFK